VKSLNAIVTISQTVATNRELGRSIGNARFENAMLHISVRQFGRDSCIINMPPAGI